MNRSKRKSIGPNPAPGSRLSAGIGYVVIPSDVDRQLYIDQCFRTGTIMMYTEEQEVIRDVSVDEDTIQQIQFPETIDDLGSAIAWLLLPLKKQPIVTALILKNDETLDIIEHQRRLRKQTDTGLAEISLRGDKGLIGVIVDGETPDSGQLNITVSNRSNNAQLNINIKGKAKIVASDSIELKAGREFVVIIDDPFIDDAITTIKYTKEQGFEYSDEFGNQIFVRKDEIQVITNKFRLVQGNEAMVLGNTLKALLDDFIAAVASITTSTLIGAQPILNKAQVEALKQRTEAILSELGFLD